MLRSFYNILILLFVNPSHRNRTYRGFFLSWWFVTIVVLACTCLQGADRNTDGPSSSSVSVLPKPPQKPKPAPPVKGFSLPVSFIENTGQFDPQVKFYAKSGNKTIWFTERGLVFDLIRTKAGRRSPSGVDNVDTRLLHDRQNVNRLVFNEEFSTTNAHPKITACAPRPTSYNFFLGNDQSKWRSNVHGYSELIYHDVWPSIDVRLVAKEQNLEQEFVIHPGADPASIGIAYTGITKLRAERDGSLAVTTALGVLSESRPVIYQEIEGRRATKEGHFRMQGGSSYGFTVNSFDRKTDLVIDPTLLYSTFLGGSATDQGNAIASDAAGNAYVAGMTESGDFPGTSGPFPATAGPYGFIVKLDSAGLPIYSTLLGPASSLFGVQGIAVDRTNRAYITGMTGPGYPTTSNAYQTCSSGNIESSAGIFLTVLSAAGDSLPYSTCFGAEDAIDGVGVRALALDGSGRAFLTGSVGSSTPVTSGAYQATKPDRFASGFLAVIDPSLSGTASLVYSTFLGGSEKEIGTAVAVDLYGNAYVAGASWSYNFPTTLGAFQTANKSYYPGCTGSGCQGGNAFVAKINPNLSGSASLIYSTYLGGSTGPDQAMGITVDSSGNAYVTGSATSPDFPTTPGAFQSYSTQPGGFISKIDAGGSHLLYSSLIAGVTQAAGVTLDAANNAYVVGTTTGPAFVVTPNALQPLRPGRDDAFLLELDASGSQELYGSYLGGTYDDHGFAIALDAVGDVYLTGSTASADFPISPFAFQAIYHPTICDSGGDFCPDAFVTKLALGAPGTLSISSISPTAGGNAGTVTPQIIGSGFHAGATVQLKCGSQTVTGSNSVFGPLGRIVNATFDLTSTQPGTCNVVVTNVDGTSATLPKAFTVQQGGAPHIHISVTGVARREAPFEVPMANIDEAYFITATNLGNIDYPASIIAQSLNSPLSVASVNPSGATLAGSSANGSFVLWPSPLVPPRASQTFVSTVVLPGLGIPGIPSPIIGSSVCPLQIPPGLSAVDQCIATNTTFENISDCAEAAEHCVDAVSDCNEAATNPTDANISRCIASTLNCVLSAFECYAGAQEVIEKNMEEEPEGEDCSPPFSLTFTAPSDPNSLAGPYGVGAQKWLPGTAGFSYVVSFNNEPTATAPAQQVVVVLPLDPSVNVLTITLAGVSLANGANTVQVSIPPGGFSPASGLDEFMTSIDLRPTQSLLVDVDAKLNLTTQTLTWTLTSIDPITGLPPSNPLVGFLPPGAGASVAFSIAPTKGIATGAQVAEQATVIFDANEPESTDIWTNTIDNTPPTSQIAALSATESSPSFTVNWSGADVGSGIGSYTVYVSDNGAPFTAWQTNTTATGATYTGVVGHTYGFYSIATDLVGNMEPAKTTAETTTTVQSGSRCAMDVSGQVTITRGGFRLNHATNTFVQTVTLTNNGAPLSNISLVLDALSGNATLSGAGGTTQCDAPLGSPWIAVPGIIATGQSVSITLNFSNPPNAGISYTTRVLAGSGQQ